jgi:hypothetical protein
MATLTSFLETATPDEQTQLLDDFSNRQYGKPYAELDDHERQIFDMTMAWMLSEEEEKMNTHPYGNGKVFACSKCKTAKPLTHFLTSPKCWRSIQQRIKRQFDKLPPEEQKQWTGRVPEWGPYCMECKECEKLIYWEDFWPLKNFHCPKCYPEHLKERRNRQARRRYGRKSPSRVPVKGVGYCCKPTCEHCGEEFKSVRSDAKFCSPKCRVAANRAKSAKDKSTTKRRVKK